MDLLTRPNRRLRQWPSQTSMTRPGEIPNPQGTGFSHAQNAYRSVKNNKSIPYAEPSLPRNVRRSAWSNSSSGLDLRSKLPGRP
jgi:hypothetical protein